MARHDAMSDELIRQRELRFSTLHPDPRQGETAYALLQTLELFHHVELVESHCLIVRYSVRDISLEIIEGLLQELGFTLESSLLIKLMRSLYYFTEETQRTNLGISHDSVYITKQVFIERYQHLRHGCRDDYPVDLRHYR